MKQFESIKKRMPYAESDDYLNQLIERSTEEAIRRAAKPKARLSLKRPVVTAIAAAMALLLVVGITQFRPQTEQQVVEASNDGPIDEFLNNLTDEEAQFLAYYEVEEIPEY